MNNMKRSPIMGEMPNPNPSECDGVEKEILLTREEIGALFNAVGFTCTSIRAMQCVVQEPVVNVLVDEELDVYAELRTKLFTFLNQA